MEETCLGAYALVDASEDVLRYEAGLYSSQGIGRARILEAWMVLHGHIPVLAYAVGVLAYVAFSAGSSIQLEIVLPLVISAPTILLSVNRRLNRIVNSAPYVTVRS